MELELESQTLPESASPYARWEAGDLSARDAAIAIVQELITEIEPAEHTLEVWKRRGARSWGTLLIRLGEPLAV